MQYLVAQMLVCLLVAGLLGLLIGWLLWGMLVRRLRERSAEMEGRAQKLSGYPARLEDLEATHAAFVASKNEEDAKSKARFAELDAAAAKVPLLEKKLAAKTGDWETLRTLMDEKKTELATVQAKLNELEAQHQTALTAAAIVPDLTDKLQTSAVRVGELERAVKEKNATIADHMQAHTEKDVRLASLTGRVAELEPLAQRVPLLEAQVAQHVDAHREKDEHLEQLLGQVDDLKGKSAQLPDLQTELAAKETQLAEMSSALNRNAAEHAGKDQRIADLTAEVKQQQASHAEKDAHIAELAALAALVPELKSHLTQKDEHLDALLNHVNELKPLAEQVPDLTEQLQQHEAVYAEKETRIAELAPLAAQVPILTAQIQQHEAEHAAKDAHIAALTPLAAQLPELQAQLAEKDQHVGALLSRIEELQPLTSAATDVHGRVEAAEYEANLANRKLRMAETSVASWKSEIAQLQDQILRLKGEAEHAKNTAAAAPAGEALKTFAAAAGAGIAGAAAMGFYDVHEGSVAAQTEAPAAAQDHVLEFEKRMEEMKNAESAKDTELAKLRSKLADIEAAPDPDTRRQILFAAKNAELTHLRGVLNSLFQPVGQDEVAVRAFTYAKERGFGDGGSAMEDWLRAERDTHFNRLAYAWESTRTGTMF